MNARDAAGYKEQLLAQRDDLRHQLQERAREIPNRFGATAAEADLPTHPADRDLEGLTAELETARAQHSAFEAIQAALRRLEQGSFGRCQRCGRAIPEERLHELAHTAYCVECARLSEA